MIKAIDCVADYDSNTNLQRYYITPLLDENLLVYDEAVTDKEYFYVHDGLGTVRSILGSFLKNLIIACFLVQFRLNVWSNYFGDKN